MLTEEDMGRKKAMLSMVLGISILVLIVIIVKVIPQSIRNSQKNTKTEQSQEASEKKTKKKDKNIEQAKLLAMGYDYDGAINLLKSVIRQKNEKRWKKKMERCLRHRSCFFVLALNRYCMCFSSCLDILIEQNWHSC